MENLRIIGLLTKIRIQDLPNTKHCTVQLYRIEGDKKMQRGLSDCGAGPSHYHGFGSTAL
jgi:hypothetical protein